MMEESNIIKNRQDEAKDRAARDREHFQKKLSSLESQFAKYQNILDKPSNLLGPLQS